MVSLWGWEARERAYLFMKGLQYYVMSKLPEELQNSSGINISTNTALRELHGVDFRGQAATADATWKWHSTLVHTALF